MSVVNPASPVKASALSKCLRIAGLLAGSLVLATVVWFASDWGYWKRWLTRPADMLEPPDSFYQPVAVVRGVAAPFFSPQTPGETISVQSLEEAAAWAAAHASTALIVWHDGKIALERYWQGLGPDQLFTGRSMSKTLAPLMIGAAIADGRIGGVDDPVSKYLSEWADDPRGALTLRQLLQNTSGFEPMPIDPNPFRKGMHMVLGTDFAAAAMAFELADAPGTRFAVHNVNSQLLGIVVERATGQPFEDYLSTKLWAPLGAGNGELYMDRKGGMPSTYCCFRATPRDWMRLGAALASEGRVGDRQVIPADWLREMQLPSALNPNYGYSLWLGSPADGVRRYASGTSGYGVRHSEPFVAPDIFFLEGGGFRTLWVVPSRRLAILRLGYSHDDWDTVRIPNIILRGMATQAGGAAGATATVSEPRGTGE